jgi:uncharacterized membrane protein
MSSKREWLRALLALLFIAAGVMHFVTSSFFVSIVPPYLPYPLELVYLSGACEILGGVGVLVGRLRRFAGVGLIALLLAVFPANIHMAVASFRADGWTAYGLLLLLRLPLQFVLIAWVYFCAVAKPSRPSAEEAREQLLACLPDLQRRFFEAARASGKPRGLRWKSCEWSGAVEVAREKRTGDLAALVGVTVGFEAVEGGDMEGLPAVGNLRNASAVFFYHRGGWHTTGKAVFNLNPDEAIERFAAGYERA